MKHTSQSSQNKQLAAIKDRPNSYPFIGLITGLSIWMLDSFIDVYILDEEQTLLENIFTPEITEFWMRSLVTVILVAMGFFSRNSIIKHIELDKRLLNHQYELARLVDQRTEELQLKTDELLILAHQDPLTGLSNRRRFNEILQIEYNRFKRHKVEFCLLMIDIDYFKNVNDQYGHDIGDKVIKTFSQTINDNIRITDKMARWGGEEFIILAVEATNEKIKPLSENIRNTIKNIKYDDVSEITASIGVTCSCQSDSLETMLKRVDDALYLAKNNGRNRIEYL